MGIALQSGTVLVFETESACCVFPQAALLQFHGNGDGLFHHSGQRATAK